MSTITHTGSGDVQAVLTPLEAVVFQKQAWMPLVQRSLSHVKYSPALHQSVNGPGPVQ